MQTVLLLHLIIASWEVGRNEHHLSSDFSEVFSDQIFTTTYEEDETNNSHLRPPKSALTSFGDNDVIGDTPCIKEEGLDNMLDDAHNDVSPNTIENDSWTIPSEAAHAPQEDAIQSGSNDLSNCANESVDIYPSDLSLNISYIDTPTIAQNYDRDVQRVRPSIADAETLSRLYRRELITQVICYIFVFALTTVPLYLLVINSSNGLPRKNIARVTFILHPLAGLFNILVYTRWNVRSLRRRNREYSWFRAFWLVLKAGGDLPREQV